MKNRFAFLPLLAFALLYRAEKLNSQTTFQKTYGSAGDDVANWVVNTSTGFLVVGYTTTPNGTGEDGYLLRLDPAGNTLWQKKIGGMGADRFNVACETSDGFWVLGETDGHGTAEVDIWLLKIDSAGTVLWRKTIGNSGTKSLATAMIPVSGNRVLVSGAQAPEGSSVFQSCFFLLDSVGHTLWSHTYDSGSLGNIMRSNYVQNGVIYASGGMESGGGFMRLDLETGAVISAMVYPGNNSVSLDYQQPLSDGNLLLCDYTRTLTNGTSMKQWVNKVTPSGHTIWSKVYDRPLGNLRGSIEKIGDDNFLLTPYDGFFTANGDALLAIIDQAGNVLWSRNYGSEGLDWIWKSQLTSDGGIVSVGGARGVGGNLDILIVKTDADGRLAGCCVRSGEIFAENLETDDVTVSPAKLNWLSSVDITSQPAEAAALSEQAYCANPPVEIFYDIALCPSQPYTFGGVDYYAPGEFMVVHPGVLGCDTILHYGLLAYPQVTRYDTIVFCPGEQVVVGGQVYTQPGTVVVTIPAQVGCDTLLRYTLVSQIPAYSTVSIQCPPDISYIIDADNVPVEVQYDLPEATSDCPCSGLTLRKTAGFSSGSDFPSGSTTVCYTAEDLCGSTASCCFHVGIQAEQPCDVKVIGCMRYELLSITTDPAHHQTYRIRVVNHCANKLFYTAIQLPDGVVATVPEHLSVFTAESGRQYDVRNPNATPFYSIRFRSANGSISGGESEIFQYTLPAQTAPAYLDIASRLTSQAWYETHLNTFNCPILALPVGDRDDFSVKEPQEPFHLFPNPTDDVLWVDCGLQGREKVAWQIFDAKGVLLTRGAQVPDGGAFHIELPGLMPNGLFFLEIMGEDGQKERQSFVLQRR